MDIEGVIFAFVAHHARAMVADEFLAFRVGPDCLLDNALFNSGISLSILLWPRQAVTDSPSNPNLSTKTAQCSLIGDGSRWQGAFQAMKADTWKAVLAAMSPSPVFQAIAELAELRVDHRRRALVKQTYDTNGLLWSRRANNPKRIV
jgi:hypothetical protein